jgi:hypothetical protein
MLKGGSCPIPFSNGSIGGSLILSDIDALGCLRSLRARTALDGVSWVQSGLVEIAVSQIDRMLQNRRRHLLPPWASLRSGARFDLLSS